MDQNPFDDDQQGSTATASDFFASGSPSCRFTNIGDTHTGKIVTFEESQQKDIQTGQPKFWPDGNPCQMLVITLATNERDAEIEDDDGQRRLYVNKPSGMFVAIKAAVGKNKFANGGTLAIKYVKNGKPKAAGFSPPKEYAAKYTPPAGVADMNAAPGGHWTWDEAKAKCAEAGIPEAQLTMKLKNMGLTSYSPARDTSGIKEIIAAHKQWAAQNPGSNSSSGNFSANRPGAEVLDGEGVDPDSIPF